LCTFTILAFNKYICFMT